MRRLGTTLANSRLSVEVSRAVHSKPVFAVGYRFGKFVRISFGCPTIQTVLDWSLDRRDVQCPYPLRLYAAAQFVRSQKVGGS